jgi:hypothetical protein
LVWERGVVEDVDGAGKALVPSQ